MTAVTPPSDALHELTRTLWQQRRLLERVHYHLRVQELILAAGEDALLGFAVNDVEETLRAVAEVEETRERLTGDIGYALGLGSRPALVELIAATEDPFPMLLEEQRTALMDLTSKITAVSVNGREQLQRGLALTRELAATVLGDRGDGGYDATGAVVRGSAERRLFDREM